MVWTRSDNHSLLSGLNCQILLPERHCLCVYTSTSVCAHFSAHNMSKAKILIFHQHSNLLSENLCSPLSFSIFQTNIGQCYANIEHMFDDNAIIMADNRQLIILHHEQFHFIEDSFWASKQMLLHWMAVKACSRYAIITNTYIIWQVRGQRQ